MSALFVECRGCAHYKLTTVFELCQHEASHYTADGKKGWHTISHMRKHSCASGAVLFQARKEP